MWANPDDMINDDKALLEEDFLLGASTVTDREFWVASLEAVISAAEYKR